MYMYFIKCVCDILCYLHTIYRYFAVCRCFLCLNEFNFSFCYTNFSESILGKHFKNIVNLESLLCNAVVSI